ncbi:MAG TPA: GvpL/GvpF family gas vesicle protein, partial [Verrucomicrobiae bacterium]|nr:GvpL/GvpF family gas vesicle protein [Verrucomicrobiae bacterium]
MTALRYVYGIVPQRAAASIDRASLRGIDETPVRALTVDPLAAAISDLDGNEWDAETLNDRVQDVEWLAPRAEAHQGVNAKLLEIAGVVLPLSFGALYRDDDGVREMLSEDVPAKEERLASLDGRAEWVVTLVRDAQGAPAGAEADLRDLDREIASSAPGRGYLLEKRRTTVAAEAAERADADAARIALGALDAAAERTYREPVARGGRDLVVLRVSLLAPRA